MRELGSFRIFGSAHGGRGANWVCFACLGHGMPCPHWNWVRFAFWLGAPGRQEARGGGELGSFRIIWLLAVCFWQLAGLRLGSFRIFGVGRDTWYAGIGFVSGIVGLGGRRDASGTVNWVRFG